MLVLDFILGLLVTTDFFRIKLSKGIYQGCFVKNLSVEVLPMNRRLHKVYWFLWDIVIGLEKQAISLSDQEEELVGEEKGVFLSTYNICGNLGTELSQHEELMLFPRLVLLTN